MHDPQRLDVRILPSIFHHQTVHIGDQQLRNNLEPTDVFSLASLIQSVKAFDKYEEMQSVFFAVENSAFVAVAQSVMYLRKRTIRLEMTAANELLNSFGRRISPALAREGPTSPLRPHILASAGGLV